MLFEFLDSFDGDFVCLLCLYSDNAIGDPFLSKTLTDDFEYLLPADDVDDDDVFNGVTGVGKFLLAFAKLLLFSKRFDARLFLCGG